MKQPIGKVTTARTTAQGVADTEAFIAYLDARSDVEGDKTGTVDFCMWGGMVIVAAGTWPDRFAALVSFHGGNLATEAADSPHVYSPKLKADLYIAAAENDATYPLVMAEKLIHALEDSQVSYRAETYPAPHGCRAQGPSVARSG